MHFVGAGEGVLRLDPKIICGAIPETFCLEVDSIELTTVVRLHSVRIGHKGAKVIAHRLFDRFSPYILLFDDHTLFNPLFSCFISLSLNCHSGLHFLNSLLLIYYGRGT